MEDVGAGGEAPAALAGAEGVEADDAVGVGKGSLGETETGELVDFARGEGGGGIGGGGGAGAEAVEGAAEEEEVEEEEGGEAQEEEEEGGEKEHDDGLEEEGKEVRVRFWMGMGLGVMVLCGRRHGDW